MYSHSAVSLFDATRAHRLVWAIVSHHAVHAIRVCPPSLGDAMAEMTRQLACATQAADGSCRLGVDDEVEPVGACVAGHVGGGGVLGVGGAADQTHLRWGVAPRLERVQ